MLLSYIVYSSLHLCVDQVNTRVYSSLHLGNLNISILKLHFYLISISVTKSNITMSGSMNNVFNCRRRSITEQEWGSTRTTYTNYWRVTSCFRLFELVRIRALFFLSLSFCTSIFNAWPSHFYMLERKECCLYKEQSYCTMAVTAFLK